MGVSVLIPTRDRPARFRRAVEGCLSKAQGEVDVLAYVDDDDPSLEKYKEIKIEGLEITVGPRVGIGKGVHKIMEAAKGEFMFFAADDVDFITPGWDVFHVEQIPPDGIGLVWCNDRWKQTCNHFMVHRKWYELTGLFPDDFEHWGPDTYVRQVAEELKRYYFLPDVVIEHHHFKNNKMKLDATYSECRAGSVLDRDKKRLKDYQSRLKRDVEVLKGHID